MANSCDVGCDYGCEAQKLRGQVEKRNLKLMSFQNLRNFIRNLSKLYYSWFLEDLTVFTNHTQVT